jgi:hypothetical protein
MGKSPKFHFIYFKTVNYFDAFYCKFVSFLTYLFQFLFDLLK